PQEYTAYSSFPVKAPLVADGNRLYSLSNDGVLTAFSTDAPDVEAPVISTPKPAQGSSLNGAPPIYFTVSLSDDGSGINPATIQLTLDGVPIDQDPQRYDAKIAYAKRNGFVYDPIKQKVTYVFGADSNQSTVATSVEKRLAPGRHEVALVVDDWRGNATEL